MTLQEEDYGASTSPDNWDFRNYHVASDLGGQNAGRFGTSEGMFLAAGPPRAKDNRGQSTSVTVFPIGVVDNISLNQNKLIQQMFECGSRRSYFVSGRTTGSLGLSRPLFNGPSLLRATQGRALSPGLGSRASATSPGLFPNGGVGRSDGVGLPVNENETEVWINLQSEVFDRPLGIFAYLIDQRKRPIASMYIEECMIQGHGMNMAAQGITIPENISMMFDRIVPVAVNRID